jgi:hypothetical protein
VVQLYPQALGIHFSRLLRHAWVTVGLFVNPGHHTEGPIVSQEKNCSSQIPSLCFILLISVFSIFPTPKSRERYGILGVVVKHK